MKRMIIEFILLKAINEKLLLFLIICLVTFGCAKSNYFLNRLHDAEDVVTLTAGAGVGGKVTLGALYLNTFGVYHRDFAGIRYGDFITSGSQDSDIGSWFGWGQSWHTRTELQKHRGKAPEYSFTDIPFLMTRKRGAHADPLAIDCSLGLGPSVRLGFSPMECIDFLVGWSTLDLAEDDKALGGKIINKEEESKK